MVSIHLYNFKLTIFQLTTFLPGWLLVPHNKNTCTGKEPKLKIIREEIRYNSLKCSQSFIIYPFRSRLLQIESFTGEKWEEEKWEKEKEGARERETQRGGRFRTKKFFVPTNYFYTYFNLNRTTNCWWHVKNLSTQNISYS